MKQSNDWLTERLVEIKQWLILYDEFPHIQGEEWNGKYLLTDEQYAILKEIHWRVSTLFKQILYVSKNTEVISESESSDESK